LAGKGDFLDLQIVMDASVVALRILLPIYAMVIVYQCYKSMRHHRRAEKPLLTLEDVFTGQKYPVVFWENSIGRSKRSDICIQNETVSRDHSVLLRREDGWFITDTKSKAGTYVNGKKTRGRVKVMIDDEISVGSTTLAVRRGSEYSEEIKPSWYFSKAKTKPSIKQYKLMILITVFHLLMALAACFSNEIQDFKPLVVWGFLTALGWTFFFVSTVILKRVNFELEALGFFLTGLGIMLLVRQVERQAYTQMITAAMGMVLFIFLIKFMENPDRVKKYRTIIMIGAVAFLAINLVFGKIQHGAANWISIGSFTIQPSEFVKIAFIFVGAATLDQLQTSKNLLEYIIFSAVCVGALAVMGDFGTGLIFFVTFLFIAFMRSGDFKTIILAVTAAVFAGAMVLKFKPYIADRFVSWGHVWEYAQTNAYQQARVLTYTASGGLFGVGVGNGCLKYVFASENDLVFGLVAEEMGIIVAVICAIAIGGLVLYSRAITTRSRSTFYSISACCAAGLLLFQMALNIFGATDILPLTGVTLPFISLGGSSMISCWGLLAFIKAADERTYAMRRK